MNRTYFQRSSIRALAIVFALAGFLGSAALAHAEIGVNTSSAAHQRQSQSEAAPDLHAMSLSGCLLQSHGQFWLTASNGRRWDLTADPGIDLGADIDHAVIVTGSLGAETSHHVRTLLVSKINQEGFLCKG